MWHGSSSPSSWIISSCVSDEHFSVDGTQIAAWASMKSFRAKDGSDDPPGSGGLIVAATLTKATGTAERAAAETMIVRHSPGVRRLTLAADKGYDAAAFVADMRALNVTPHIAQNISGRRSAIDARTTRHGGYVVSQQKRKRIEESFGWGKTIGGLARPMLRGVKKLGFKFTLTMAGYNLIRLPKLIEAAT